MRIRQREERLKKEKENKKKKKRQNQKTNQKPKAHSRPHHHQQYHHPGTSHPHHPMQTSQPPKVPPPQTEPGYHRKANPKRRFDGDVLSPVSPSVHEMDLTRLCVGPPKDRLGHPLNVHTTNRLSSFRARERFTQT